MYDMIAQKQTELARCMPKDPEFSAWLVQSDLWSWAYSFLRIQGERVSKSSVVAALSGQLKDDVPLSLYAFLSRYKGVYQDMKTSLAMGLNLDLRMLNRWAGMLTGRDDSVPEKTLYRSNNPIIYEWELIPVHFREIKEELSSVLRTAAAAKHPADPLDKAAYVHLEIDRLYPYGEDTALVSSAALLYELMQLGLPAPELSVGDVEYNKMIAKYAEDRNRSAFTDMLSRSVYNRLEAVLTLARQAKDAEEGKI